MPVDPENPRLLRRPPPTGPVDFVSPSGVPQVQTGGGLQGRPTRPLNPRQQARADALAALTPRQIANRARRQGGANTHVAPPPPSSPGGVMGIPTKPLPTSERPGGSFVPLAPPPSDGSGWLPPGGPQPAPPGSGGGSYNPMTDPWKLFEQMVPVMNLNRDKQISDSMATAGFSGNRFGSWAGGKAAEIGAENSLSQDALLGQLLSNFANNQEDRSLQGTRLGLDSAALQDQMLQARLLLPFQMGQYEQGRQDQFSNTAFQDWAANRLGWLGPLLNAANQQGAGSPGQIYTTQTPGSPGVAGYADLIRAIFGGD